VAEGARLESVYTARYPGFESLSLRHTAACAWVSVHRHGEAKAPTIKFYIQIRQDDKDAFSQSRLQSLLLQARMKSLCLFYFQSGLCAHLVGCIEMYCATLGSFALFGLLP
jgi:hypothetical protein